METPRYLPANRVRQSGLRPEGLLSLRTLDGQKVGVVQGFVLEPGTSRIRSLVIDTGTGQRELPISPLQYRFESSSAPYYVADERSRSPRRGFRAGLNAGRERRRSLGADPHGSLTRS